MGDVPSTHCRLYTQLTGWRRVFTQLDRRPTQVMLTTGIHSGQSGQTGGGSHSRSSVATAVAAAVAEQWRQQSERASKQLVIKAAGSQRQFRCHVDSCKSGKQRQRHTAGSSKQQVAWHWKRGSSSRHIETVGCKIADIRTLFIRVQVDKVAGLGLGNGWESRFRHTLHQRLYAGGRQRSCQLSTCPLTIVQRAVAGLQGNNTQQHAKALASLQGPH